MGYPNIPDINPDINLNRDEVIDLLLASIALEELSLAHLVNGEAEKLQRALGTLQIPGTDGTSPDDYFQSLIDNSFDNLLRVNRSINKTLKLAMHKEFILLTKLEDILDFVREEQPPVPPTPPLLCDQCSIRAENEQGGPDPVAAVVDGQPLTGTATYLINLCNNCGGSNNFNFDFVLEDEEGQDFNFNFTQGRATRIIACDPENDTATFEGTINLASGDSYFATVTITETTITFAAVNLEGGTPQTFNATLTIDPVETEIEPCPRPE